MIDYLYELLSQKTYTSVYFSPNNTKSFAFGRILSIDGTNVEIYLVSPNGDFDGILVKPIDDIFRVQNDGQYSDKMTRLMMDYVHEPEKYVLKCNNLFESVLSFASDNELIVSIELLNSGYDDVIGFVQEIKNGGCVIKQIDEYGAEDGISKMRICDITQVCCDSQDERRIERLWRAHKQKF